MKEIGFIVWFTALTLGAAIGIRAVAVVAVESGTTTKKLVVVLVTLADCSTSGSLFL